MEQRREYVLESWRCLGNCEICGRCHFLKGRDPETLYADYINGIRPYIDVTKDIRDRNMNL